MTGAERFVRLYPVDKHDPGARLRVEFPGDEGSGCAVFADERVLPEAVLKPDASHVESFGAMWLDRAGAEWLYAVLAELIPLMPPGGAQ